MQRFLSGQFFGQYRTQRNINGSNVADLIPTIPAHDIDEHSHEDAHFLLLLRGRYVSSAIGMPAVCQTPAILINPPGTQHRDCFEHLDGRFMTISVSTQAWASCAQAQAMSERAKRLGNQALFAGIRIWRELHQWDSSSNLKVESELNSLLLAAMEPKSRASKKSLPWLERACERLCDDFGNAPTLSELAALTDLHPVYFVRAFRQRMGCTPGDYLRQRRLLHALCLLTDRKMNLLDIALQCGFADPSHLHRHFQKYFHISPSVYRRLSREDAKVYAVQENARVRQ